MITSTCSLPHLPRLQPSVLEGLLDLFYSEESSFEGSKYLLRWALPVLGWRPLGCVGSLGAASPVSPRSGRW